MQLKFIRHKILSRKKVYRCGECIFTHSSSDELSFSFLLFALRKCVDNFPRKNFKFFLIIISLLQKNKEKLKLVCLFSRIQWTMMV